MNSNQEHRLPATMSGSVNNDSTSVLMQLQATLNQWLTLQQSQMRVSERFLETQERIAMACLQGNGALASVASTVSPRNSLAAPAASQAPPLAAEAPQTAAVRRPTVAAPVSSPPISRAVAPSSYASPAGVNGQNGHAKEVSEPARPSAPTVTASPAPTAKTASVSGAALPPPTEEFREALLQAVSERTGYPIQMLGEDRQLEADLGIDSIKTVEIFSSLKEFHVYLPGGDADQEESLAEFASMKTLRDIINVYDRRRAGTMAEQQGAVAVASSATSVLESGVSGRDANGSGKPVERYTLEATPAPLSESDSKKKNSHSSTSC